MFKNITTIGLCVLALCRADRLTVRLGRHLAETAESSDDDGPSCPICMCSYNDEMPALCLMPCLHQFCERCIRHHSHTRIDVCVWNDTHAEDAVRVDGRKNDECPICKAKFEKDNEGYPVLKNLSDAEKEKQKKERVAVLNDPSNRQARQAEANRRETAEELMGDQGLDPLLATRATRQQVRHPFWNQFQQPSGASVIEQVAREQRTPFGQNAGQPRFGQPSGNQMFQRLNQARGNLRQTPNAGFAMRATQPASFNLRSHQTQALRQASSFR